MGGFPFTLGELWHVAGAQIILVFMILGLILLDLRYTYHKRTDHIDRLGWLTALFLAAVLFHFMYQNWNAKDLVLTGIFSIEKFAVFVSCLIVLSGIIVTLLSIGYLRNNKLVRGEYYVLLLIAIYGAIAFVQSIDLLMMFISLEIMSLSVYVLVAFLKRNVKCLEGAMKYFLLGSFGSAFFLFGLALLYGFAGTLNLAEIATYISKAGRYDQVPVLAALAMIMVGLFFKMALVPFHMWTPDVYEGSPAVITGFMATAVKACAFAVFIKVLFITFTPLLSHSGKPEFFPTVNLAALSVYWKPLLWWLAIITMFIGNVTAVSQHNVKRMLAYSSIAHAGYMAVGLVAANDDGRMGVLFYLFSYTLMNLGAFGVLYILDGQEGRAQTLTDYRGLGYKYPALAFLMSLFLVAMAGLPPTAGFIGKFYVFSAAIKEGYFLLAALGVLTSVIGAYYYLRVIYMLYMKEPVHAIERGEIAAPAVIALVATALGVLYLGVLPEGLAQVADAAQKSLSAIF